MFIDYYMKKIDLQGNNISNVPKEFGLLYSKQHCPKIYLHENPLSSVPSELHSTTHNSPTNDSIGYLFDKYYNNQRPSYPCSTVFNRVITLGRQCAGKKLSLYF